MQAIADIIKYLLIFVAVMFALLIVLIFVIAKLPDGHPLKRLMTELCWRIGVTFGVSALAIPIEPIPGLDAAYDIIGPIVLLIYWFTFFRDAYRSAGTPPRLDRDPPGRR